MDQENEVEAIRAVMVICRDCKNKDCKYPCKDASAILSGFNLEYKG
jgi:hypothetical protein